VTIRLYSYFPLQCHWNGPEIKSTFWCLLFSYIVFHMRWFWTGILHWLTSNVWVAVGFTSLPCDLGNSIILPGLSCVSLDTRSTMHLVSAQGYDSHNVAMHFLLADSQNLVTHMHPRHKSKPKTRGTNSFRWTLSSSTNYCSLTELSVSNAETASWILSRLLFSG
jgi:hypothetical protein